jgi:hypothetical protein
MGLDMYLYASKVLCSKYHGEDETKIFNTITTLINAEDFVNKDDLCFAKVEVQVAYWRKANAVHKFFVDLAGGEDDQQDIYVERENLQELLNHCDTILENKDVEKAKELLPTQVGFFFGSTEYDEWYFQDLEYTQKVLAKIIKDSPKDWEFYYRSSW